MQAELDYLEFADMAVTETVFEKLKVRVSALENKPERPERPATWLEQNQLIFVFATLALPTIAILVALFAIVMPHLGSDMQLKVEKQVTADLREPLQNFEKMSNDIAEIKGTLNAWKPIMGPLLLKQSSSLPQDQFNKSLSQVRQAMHLVSETQSSFPPDALSQISTKLRRTSESSPDYWPTVLQFIQFASQSAITPTDVPPDSGYNLLSNIRCIGVAICVKASHQAFVLDGGDIPNSVFDHCRIKFTVNPVGLKGVRFIDCVFEMPIESQPNPYLKNSAKILLASNLSRVSFPS